MQEEKADQLRALFQETCDYFGNASILYTPIALAPNDSLKCKNYTIYPFYCLPDLLLRLFLSCPKDVKCSFYEDDYKEAHSLFFVVRPTGEIVFSPAGHIAPNIPSHSQLSEQCLASGVLVYSDDYSEIIEITNKSDHHLCNEASLLWPLAILFQMGAPFASVIKLTTIEHDKVYCENAPSCPLNVSITQLRGLLPNNLPDFTIHNQKRAVEKRVSGSSSSGGLFSRKRYDYSLRTPSNELTHPVTPIMTRPGSPS
jgi:hypothetical protein